jgi:ABC-type antimicrobial peptide transport system permease subunit
MYNLKIAFRNLSRNGVYSTVNMVGLTVSLLACILTTLWIQDELSYDRFHKDGEQIYRVLFRRQGNVDYWQSTPAPLAAFIKPDIPEITEYCRMGWYYYSYLDYNNVKFRNLKGYAVDTSFFEMFSFQLVNGNPTQLFPDDLSIILSKTQSEKIFGEEDPIGKTLIASNGFTFHVTGVMKDFPDNSSLEADFLVRFDVQQRTYPGNGYWKEIEEDWGNYHYFTYLKLIPNSNIASITERMNEKADRINEDMFADFRLQPLYEMHLYASNGEPEGMKNVYIMSIIAALILGIACINYINLVTARASRRGRETAVRKIMGARKRTLLQMFLSEPAILLFCSLILTVFLIHLLLPFFNEISGKNLLFTFNLSVVLIYLFVALIVLLFAGAYPAFMLSSFNPLYIFRVERKKKAVLLRKILVVLQFAISTALIIATITLTLQLRYMQNLNPGYSKENILMTYAGNIGSHYQTVKQRLLEESTILDVSTSSLQNMRTQGSRTDIWKDEETGQWPIFHQADVDAGFFALMDIPIVEGRDFTFQPEINDENWWMPGIIVNETAAKLIGNGQSVVGMKLQYKNDIEIIGVVKDFSFLTLKENVQPLVVWYTPFDSYIYVKIAQGSIEKSIAVIEKIWKEYNPDYEFNYNFINDDFDRMYKTDIRMNKLFSIFAIIAILISCLGLFGLVTYTAETKTKEIGIRKVMGASIASIIKMLSKEFLILVGISLCIAFPLSYYWLEKMLQNYAYRINISWLVFVVAGMITLILTLLSVGWKALHAATKNPVKALKTND